MRLFSFDYSEKGTSTAWTTATCIFRNCTARMRWINTLAIALCFHRTTSGQYYTNQILLETLHDSTRQVLTPEFSDYVGHVLNRNNIPGISLGVIRKDGTFELGAWGNKTEDGEPVTPDVRRLLLAMIFWENLKDPSCRPYFVLDRLPKPSQPALLAFWLTTLHLDAIRRHFRRG